jgi:L-ascorbate metabolism protein UlaG (beta-lactamase superfamily)
MKITMIGHSTILIEADGVRVMTDPYFGTWGNPAYARLAKPLLPRQALQDVDGVLISHHHWDHVDAAFLRGLKAGTPVLTPSVWLSRLYGAREVVAASPWQSHMLGALKVTVVPARHLAVCCGYVLEAEGKAIYFAGDTYYSGFMDDIARRFKLDAALMPVTTYAIPMTMGEKAAVHAVLDLNPARVIPIHLGIQPRSPLLRTGQSVTGFTRRLAQAGSPAQVITLAEGQSIEV